MTDSTAQVQPANVPQKSIVKIALDLGHDHNLSLSINLNSGEIIISSLKKAPRDSPERNLGILYPVMQRLSTGKDGSGPLATYEWPLKEFQSYLVGASLFPSRIEKIGEVLEFDALSFCAEVKEHKAELLEKLAEASEGPLADRPGLVGNAQGLLDAVANCELPTGLKKIRVSTIGIEREEDRLVIEQGKPIEGVNGAFPISTDGNALIPIVGQDNTWTLVD